MNSRLVALQSAQNRQRVVVKLPANKISDFFAQNVFTLDAMQQYLSAAVFKSVRAAIKAGTKIDRSIADQVATAMKTWALSKGATSYTHWFQPLTGATAEKHDTFFTPLNSAKGIEMFSGSALVQQEPDGSSFPSGGLRVTFEARGYTAWDPSSPAFIMSVGESGRTLCIPTIFVSYTGEALDYKAPLLKSQHFLETAALQVCHFFDKHVQKITPTLGWEQEYFLVDAALYNNRPDLVATGRTMIGAVPPKDQQLDDHYFGSIPERVYAFMLDFETEAHKLGITISTRHNEVAPNQFECAAVHTDVNVAIDQNQLLMDLMDRVARRHYFRVLLHEKPYKGVNGSGKHNNWSLQTDTGKNLLSPGHTPKTNLQFLTFFINTIKAVHDHADLLRAAIASAGNDHRLGAHEAPPAIISAFIGSTLTGVLNELEKRVHKGLDDYDKDDIKLEIHKRIPDLLLDNTDRNRTSPFAFTGNKFEIRAVGASANCSATMIVLNTMVGNQLNAFAEAVKKMARTEHIKKDAAILRILRQYVIASKNIRFEGDNYSAAWQKTALDRGLKMINNTPDALDLYISPAATALFTQTGIYTKRELTAFFEVLLHNYESIIDIEARTLHTMIQTQVLPVAIEYQNNVMQHINNALAIGLSKSSLGMQYALVKKINGHLNDLQKLLDALDAACSKSLKNKLLRQRAEDYCTLVCPLFNEIRTHADALETLVDNRLWPLPKYHELLFIR